MKVVIISAIVILAKVTLAMDENDAEFGGPANAAMRRHRGPLPLDSPNDLEGSLPDSRRYNVAGKVQIQAEGRHFLNLSGALAWEHPDGGGVVHSISVLSNLLKWLNL